MKSFIKKFQGKFLSHVWSHFAVAFASKLASCVCPHYIMKSELFFESECVTSVHQQRKTFFETKEHKMVNIAPGI